jgi:predicted ATPase
MRLRSLSIASYKNLRDFSIEFAGDEFIDILVGKNGSGKSNFLEALIEIFDHIYGFKTGGPGPGFDYEIGWEIGETKTRLAWKDAQLSINGAARQQIGNTPLPANIIIYYSGQNDTVADLIDRYRNAYRRTVRRANVAAIPRFIGIGPDYKAILLALMLMLPENARARQYLCAKLGIEKVGSTALLTLRRPSIASKSRTYDPFDNDQLFWGVKGLARTFLDQLIGCITGAFNPGDLYDRETDAYQLNVDVQRFREAFTATASDAVFCLFNALHVLDMIEDMAIPVRLAANTEVSSRAFSDGQFQSIYLFAISELFKNRECLTLLDEPDAFLHPEWQYEFLGQILAISEEAARTNHIIMSSHSASTIASKADARLRVFELNGQAVTPIERDKGAIIESLSAGLISFSEQEARLNIEQVVGASTRPVLFTEGVSDVAIVEVAWRKLYPHQPRPFDLVQAFDCKLLRALMKRQELYQNHPGRKFFALFDFDGAYQEWQQLGDDVGRGINQGLVRKRANCEGYAILLPVPDALSIRNQVCNTATNLTWGAESHLTIELLFKDVPGLDTWFRVDPNDRAGWIHFAGDKVRFAEKVVPTLGTECFECFRPLFEFLVGAIGAETAAA